MLLDGKINKKALVFQVPESETGKETDFKSLSATQRKLLAMWEESLKIKNLSPSADFFDLGGNSLLAIRLINKIKEEFDITLTFKVFIAHSTVLQASGYIDSHSRGSEKAIKLVHNDSFTNLPLTLNQKRLWLISKLQPDVPLYITPFTYRFTGNLNIEVFRQSLEILFNRHHVVFSVIKESAGEPYIELKSVPVDLPIIDYSELPEDERNIKVNDLINQDAGKVFDIENGPLYRYLLIKTQSSEYYFRMSLHHIIFDGWSWSVFARDMNEIYNALLDEREIELGKIEYQQYDYAQWEKENALTEDITELKEFWKENLKDSLPVLNFPYDFQRKEQPSGRGLYETIHLTQDLSGKLRRLSKAENSSLFTTMLSIFGLQMQKYSGEDDINIGLPVSYRPHSKLENIFGMFVNTVVVRLRYEDDFTFKEIIHRTNDAALNAIARQELPFETIVEIVNPERSSNVNPLFQVGFIWQHNFDRPLNLRGLKCEKISGKERSSNFDITFYMWERGGHVEGEIEYSIDILKQETVLRMKDNFIALAQSVADEPDTVLRDISIVSEADRKMLLEFNDTVRDVPSCLIHELFEKQVIANPLKTALISGDSRISYGELEKRSNQYANYLISIGVSGGDVVGICMERTTETVIALLGILKSGCCYLPMDPMFPDDRIAYMFEDSGAKVLISQSSLRDKFLHFPETKIILTDFDNDKISGFSPSKPVINIDNQSLSYMIYTSGSTGKPKGVRVHHDGVVNFILSMLEKPGINENDILLAVVTLSFDMSVYELFVPLSAGATVVVASSAETTDGPALINLIEKHQISLISATPSFWSIVLAAGWEGSKRIKGLCGGEALTPGFVNQILPKVSEFWNCYGPTETVVYSTCIRITSSDLPILIGKPINNTFIHILDRNMRELPAGVTGEVCIGGRGVTKGYNNLPALTAEKFIDLDTGIRVYRTGDLGRFLSDGNIELFGRSDNQIKLRGFRIEPGEIESLLTRMPSVQEAVVTIHKFDEHDQRLVAYLNVDESFNLTREEMITALSENLPAYMIPSFFQPSLGFPRLPNGKINKKALALEIEEIEKEESADFESLTLTQRKLVSIWGEVLKSNDIAPSRSFYDLGGNSLLTIRLLNRLKEEFGLTISFKTFIAHPSVILSGEYIDSQTQKAEEEIKLEHIFSTTNLPLTRNQKRLWLIWKLNPDVASYIIPHTFKFTGSLDIDKFRESLEILFNRHHTIYSVIREMEGEPFLDIVPVKPDLHLTDLSGLNSGEQTTRVREILEGDLKTVFDLAKGPLFRLYLIKTAHDEYYFRVSLHHIIFDGWSWSVFVKDINVIYNSLLNEKKINLDSIDIQQYDFAFWEKKSDKGKNTEELTSFWKENLTGSSKAINFPYDFPRRENISGRGNYVPVKLTSELTEKLREISREEGSSLFATMLAAFGVEMHRYSGDDDLNIGLPVAYRPHSKLENIFGMFVNTVVVRLKYGNDLTFRKVISQTGDAALNAMAHQELSFENVVKIINPERSTGSNPLFQVSFVWQHNFETPLSLEGIKAEKYAGSDRITPFDITVYFWENGSVIEGEIEYSTDLLKHESILRIRENFVNLLEIMVSNIDSLVDSVQFISDDEKLLIESFTQTATGYPGDKTIIDLFREQVALYPGKTALVYKEKSLTYMELDWRSNRLARTLRNSGVADNQPVGIVAEKSIDIIVGILAILKAGGGYVPVDPDYPIQRINFILQDSGSKIVLVQDKYEGLSIEGISKISLNSFSSYSDNHSEIPSGVTSESLAYIMYTSGTTGIPKGSMIWQKGVVRLVRNTNYINLTNEDKILLTGAIVFDATTFEIWGALLNGATLYVVDKETILSPKSLGEELLNNNITVLWLTSALFTQIAESRTDIFRKLKYLLSGGDVLSAQHINRVRNSNPSLKVINGYGPTENTTFSTTFLIEKDYETNIPIGKPISNSTAYIFDSHLNYQPVGVIGELFVGGDGLSMGYLNREELNSRSFVQHPLRPGERLYRTGDYTRWLPDGNIEFHGRIDNQLKIRGFRVEIGEIAAVIAELEGVVEAVIKPVKVQEGDLRLAAFLNVKESFNMDPKEITAAIRQKLPPYMVPSAFKLMRGFPTTINGKTDRDALNIDLSEFVVRESSEAESLSANEKIIYDIWCDALKTKDISVSDNFFDIGGNSLMAISVFSKIGAAFDIDLGLRFFFDSPKIKDLAELIDIEMHNQKNRIHSESIDNNDDNNLVSGEI